jgi:hypothetical protein
LTFDNPAHIPVSLGILPAAWMQYREKLDEIADRYPKVFGDRRIPNRDYDAVGGTHVEGDHTDPWGYVWRNIRTGMQAFVTEHPVKTRADVHTLRAPERNSGFPHGFMFLRLTYLRGFEEAMVDFAEEPPELQEMIDIVLEYNLQQAEVRLAKMSKEPTIVRFGDDLGIQDSLPISPEKWRRYLKPCFAKIYKPFSQAEHYVYMHTDGHILEIIPDLIDCGVRVINPQVGANGLEQLASYCKGKVCVDLDLDRQMFPFWSPSEIDARIEEAVQTLGSPEGGLWLHAELGCDIPLENIEAICASLDKHRRYFS